MYGNIWRVLSLALIGVLGGTVVVSAARDETDLYLQGVKLKEGEAASLEKKVEAHPDDLTSRTILLGYYSQRKYRNPADRKASAKHALWIIENRPEAPVAGTPSIELDSVLDTAEYAKGKELWFAHIQKQPDNTLILSHAAHFFLLADSAQAEIYLKKLAELEPANPEWKNRLAQLYILQTINHTNAFTTEENARKALEQKEAAYALEKDDAKRFYSLNELGEFALKAGDFPKAGQYAEELLETAVKFRGDWNYGNAIHSANTTLGFIALKQGNIKAAKKHLIDSANHKGSPQLNSFGPSMDLAKALLEKGEKEAVVAYLKLCKRFWQSGQKWLDGWIDEIETTGKSALEKKY